MTINVDLTPDQLQAIKDELKVIQAIHRVAGERHAKIKELEEGSTQLLAELLVVGAVQQIEQERVKALAEALGVDLDAPMEQQLAKVYQIVDGNRRVGKR